MTIKYLYSKIFKKFIRGKSIINSDIDHTARINSGSSIVFSQFGKYSYCGYDCDIIYTHIGPFCSISDHVFIGGDEHPINWVSTSPVFQSVKHSGPKKRFALLKLPTNQFTHIGADVWVGHGVSIKQGVTIGTGAIIGTGAVVTKDIPPYAIAVGVPARVIRYRFADDIIQKLLDSKWWLLDDKILESIAHKISNPQLFLEEIDRITEI